ncbi:IclR family transcriptional regulator [Amnibacterium flavum]|uniref:Glycerol operon regulatory protein n=1 Tax=Amnibacterium flavum TaxID=2173173 RepID=A0A2V1HRT6_9MICO|nr:IclR family transcriptional regulator [Amnibacterium flavum]PVZ95268.1 hypothetical protein DDQ50_01715 [Amnibacterium flavum]
MERIEGSESGSDLQTVVRAGAVLFAFDQNTPELGLSQLATKLGLSKAAVHRLAQTLVSLGLLEQNPTTRTYRLGVRLLQLAHVVQSSLDIRHEARSHLRDLRDSTGETVYLMLRRGDGAICADRIEGSHPMRDLSTPPGTTVPLTIGASGTAILSTLDDTEVEGAVRSLDSKTAADVIERVDAARARGFAMTRGDISEGVGAIAMPLLDDRGAVVGAVSVGGLLSRVEASQVELAAAVTRTVVEIAEAMGWKQV